MPDAIHDARSRRSSGQRIPDTDIEAREAGGMRYACRDLYRLRYRALRLIAFSAENTFRAISTRSQRGVSYARDGYGSPARIGITVGASPMAARHVSADSGAARGTGRESDVTGGYMARRKMTRVASMQGSTDEALRAMQEDNSAEDAEANPRRYLQDARSGHRIDYRSVGAPEDEDPLRQHRDGRGIPRRIHHLQLADRTPIRMVQQPHR